MSDRLNLPASVRAQLAQFRRRLWWVETVLAVLAAVGAVLVGHLVLFISDRFWDTPMPVRVLLALAAVGGTVASAIYWSSRWGWRRRNTRQLARLVQSGFPRLGDRLLGIVELADETTRPPNVSAALCRAAMDQVAQEAAELKFAEAVPTGQRRRLSWVVAGLVLVVGTGLLVAPTAGWNAFQRLFKPVASIARYTLVRLEGLSADRVVAYGEPFRVKGRVGEESRWVPGQARGRYGNQAPIDAAIEDREFQFEVPGQTRPELLQVQAGDARARIRVQPTHRPELTRLTMSVRYPDYLQQPVSTQEVLGARIELVKNSEVTLSGRASRDLARAALDGAAVAVDGAELAAPARVVTEDGEWVLGWEDLLGLAGAEPLAIKVHARDDEAPTVRCTELTRVVAVLEDEVLQFEVIGDDDFGVAKVDLTWRGEGHAERGVDPAQGELDVASGGAQLSQVSGAVQFSPAALGIGPQKLVLHARAQDYLPGREPSLSPPYVIYVMDRLEHAQLVQREFDTVQERLEEIARLEESLFEQSQQLREQMDDPDIAERLAEQERAERANAEKLRRLQEEGADLLREAMRNQMIDEEVMRQWSEVLQTLQELAATEMPQVADALDSAQSESEASEREGAMNEALTRQQEVLRRMQEALQQMSDAGDQMVAGNFINRLRQAAKTETEIAGHLKELVPQTIGLPPDDLPTHLKAKVNRVERRQERNQQAVDEIREDLGGFFSRTREEVVGEVHTDMVERRVVEELGALGRQIGANVAGRSIETARDWAAALSGWADQLADAVESGDGGGGGGGGGGDEMSPELLELLMRLVRMRQAEEGLREQTRFLDRHRERNPYYESSAERMAALQQSLVDLTGRTMREYPVPQVVGLLRNVENAMKDAARLLDRPQTDRETIAAETEVIELLSETAENAASSSGGAAGQAWLLALMQMMSPGSMGASAGSAGGGSTAGGNADGPTLPQTGDPSSADHPSRRVEQATGRDRESFPAEFRDALDAYFRAREERAQ